MKLNCQPGDTAFIVQDYEHPENIGAVVRVIEEAPRNEFVLANIIWPALHQPRWIVESTKPLAFGIDGTDAGTTKIKVHRDAYLQPIRKQEVHTAAASMPRKIGRLKKLLNKLPSKQ